MRNEELEKQLMNFRALARDLHKAASTQSRKEKVTDLVKQSYRNLGIDAKDFGMECPAGWKSCPDGSCVPEGELCIQSSKKRSIK